MEDDAMLQTMRPWLDTDGRPIQAHGGCILYHGNTYYWYGENKDAPNAVNVKGAILSRVDVIGVSCYSSADLVHWKNEGLVLSAAPDDPESDLHPSMVAERPKVLYNKQTKKFVLWLHIDNASYSYAGTGVAVSDSPTGPFSYRGSFRPNGVDSRDFTVYEYRDRAYLIHSSDWNRTMRVAELSEDYCSCTGASKSIFIDQSREAPALFERKGNLYMISSGTTGWNPNPCLYARSNAMFGEWRLWDNICAGPGAETAYDSQSCFVLKMPHEEDQYILMLDQWKPENLRDSRYLWLPIQFDRDRPFVTLD
jgi:hypothetical protein